MNRREFLQASSAAGLAFSIGGKHASAFEGREAKRVGLDRQRLVRQGRPAPPDPGRPRRGRFALRRRQEDARRRGRIGRPAASLQENSSHLRRLSRNAQGERSRHRPDRHARPLARPAHDRGGRSRRRYLRPETDQHRRQRRKGHAGRRSQAPARSSRSAPSAAARPT